MTCRKLGCLLAVTCCLLNSPVIRAQDWLYHARPGDTLWDLCLEYTARRGCWQELGKYNGISNDRAIPPGSEIRIPMDWLLTRPVVATVVSVQGEVAYRERPGAQPAALVLGQDLLLGSTLESVGGNARVRFTDDAEVQLRPGSVLELRALSGGKPPGQSSELSLERGELEIEVRPASRSRFEIHTPSAIAAVRGTQYRVASQPENGTTRSEVLGGVVAVQAGSSVDVPAGFGVKARRGEPLGKPRQLLQSPIFDAGRVDATLPITLHWSADPGAVQWQLDLYEHGGAGALLDTYLHAGNTFTFTDLDQGCYRLVARGIDTDGFHGLDAEMPLCVLPPVEEPAVEEPRTYWDFVVWSIMAALMLL